MNLLLLHPLPLDGSVFSDDLRAVGDACVAPTLYEAGDEITKWAEAALVGDGPVVVVGNSIGGSCAIEVARMAPTKVEALVLCGSKPGHRPEPEYRRQALHVLASEGVRAAWERYWLPLFGPTASHDIIEQAWQSALAQGAASIATGIRAFHGRPDRAAFLNSWLKPVWIVGGEHDTAPNPSDSRRVAARLPNGSFRQVDHVGHYLPLEAPEALAAITAEACTRRR